MHSCMKTYITYGEYIRYICRFIYYNKTYVNMYNIINSFRLKFLKIFISDHLAWQMIITDGEIVYVI